MRLVAVVGVTVGLLSACGGGGPHRGSSAGPGSAPTDGVVAQRLAKGIGEQNRGDKAAALADFLAVVKLDPKDEVAWYDLGLIAQQQHQTEQAIKDYLDSLGGNPNYAPSLYNLAILETKAKPVYAEGLYERLLRLQPNNVAAHLNLGFVLLSRNRSSEAKAQFGTAMRLDGAVASRIPKAMGGTAS